LDFFFFAIYGLFLPKFKSNAIISPPGGERPIKSKEDHRMKYVCNVCGWVYDEDETGVKWEDLPEDFACELCGVGKDDFSPEE
jgi:rubredoxin